MSIDFATASPSEIVDAVSAMDEQTFAGVINGDDRSAVLDALIEVFVSYFRPDKADGIDAVIHVKLWDKPGGGYDHYEMAIRDQQIAISETPTDEEPDLTIKVRPTDLLAMVLDRTGPRRLAMKGRLRVLGDLGLGMKLGEHFAFPKAT